MGVQCCGKLLAGVEGGYGVKVQWCGWLMWSGGLWCGGSVVWNTVG